MNTEANKATLNEGYEDFVRGDIPAILKKCASDVVWMEYSTENSGLRGTYHGHEEVGNFFTQVSEILEFSKFQPVKVIAEGATVMAVVETDGKVKSNGHSLEGSLVHVLQFNAEGKIASLSTYLSHPESTFA